MPNRFSGGESVQHWLAVDKVRFVGEAICAVVAEDRATAEDACELIKVDYDPLPAVTDPRLGERDDAPLIHDTCTNNYLIKREYQRGNVDDRFANAASRGTSASSASVASRRCASKAAAASRVIARTRSR